MGSSGAGKTTLMDVVAGRKTVGRIEGGITTNGRPKDARAFARVMGYVEQTDVHAPLATVGEALRFAAALRLPAAAAPAEREALVRQVVGLVELGPLEGALVGVPGERAARARAAAARCRELWSSEEPLHARVQALPLRHSLDGVAGVAGG